MTQLTESVANLIDQLAKLPGIGRKSAERLTYHLLRVHQAEALALADAIRQVRENVRYCRICFNLAEQDTCGICRDPEARPDAVVRGRAAARSDVAGSGRHLSRPVPCAAGTHRAVGRRGPGPIDVGGLGRARPDRASFAR